MQKQYGLSEVMCEALGLMQAALVTKKTRGLAIVRMCGDLQPAIHTLAGMDTALAQMLADVQVALRDVGEHLRFFDDDEEGGETL